MMVANEKVQITNYNGAGNPTHVIAEPDTPHTGKYILDSDGNPVPCSDLKVWATWVESKKDNTDWIIGKDQVGDVEVSTIFLSLDHNFSIVGPPILFETMCFTTGHEQVDGEEFFDRYATRTEAAAGHARIVEAVNAEARA